MTDERAREILALYHANGCVASSLADALHCNARNARKFVTQAKKQLGEALTIRDQQFDERVNRLADLEERSSIPEAVLSAAQLESFELAGWGTAMKIDGKPFKDGLYSTRAKYSLPKSAAKIQWPPIQPYYQVEAKAYQALPPCAANGFRRAFVIGDVQIGFWRKADGSLVPFHDEAAIDLMLQMLARYQPNEVIIIGDFLDLPEMSKYRKEPAFANTTNPAIAYATTLLAQIRAIVGEACVISYILGNHEARLTSAIVDNLASFYGIKRHDAGDKFGVLTIPFLLQFERYAIQCTDQYPSGEVWLTDDLVCTHAPDAKLAATVISGHLVKATVDSETKYYRAGPKVYERIIVPGLGNYRGKPDDKFRICRTNIPSNIGRTNAQQAVATIDITPDGARHNVLVWKIENGSAFFREHGLLQGAAQPWEYTEAA
jgi:hypothetical protein